MNTDTPGFVIEAKGVSKRFNHSWIIRHLDFTFEPGEIYAIIGPNGSGKSTLMQILWGQMPPSEGTVQYHSRNVRLNHESLHQHIAIAAPYMDLVEEFTLREQLAFHFRIKTPIAGIKFDEIVHRMHLQDELDKHISDFSSGMKQRLKLGLAAFSKAEAVFLDEPTTNLDEPGRAWYHSLLPGLIERATVIIASNQADEYPGSAVKINLQDYKISGTRRSNED